MINLIHGDCLEKMKDIPDASVDLVLTDPPYGTTACRWDVILPFDAMWIELKRIIKPNGAIVLFGSQPFTSALIMSNPEMFKYEWIWKKSRKNGYVHAHGKPLKETEDILVFSHADVHKKAKKRMKYNPQGVIPFTAERINYVKTTRTNQGGHAVGTKWNQKGAMYPTNILTFKNVSPKEQVHPTQKPVELMEYLVKTYTDVDDVVLDFTMGSGTTGVACKNLHRNFIGIELDKKYFDVAESRIKLNTTTNFDTIDSQIL